MDLLAPESESLHLQKRVSGRSSNLKLAAQHRRNKITLQVFFLKNLKRTWEPRLDGPFQAIHLHGLSLFACVRRIYFQEYSFTFKKENSDPPFTGPNHPVRHMKGMENRRARARMLPLLWGDEVCHKRSHRTHRERRDDELEEEAAHRGRFALPWELKGASKDAPATMGR